MYKISENFQNLDHAHETTSQNILELKKENSTKCEKNQIAAMINEQNLSFESKITQCEQKVQYVEEKITNQDNKYSESLTSMQDRIGEYKAEEVAKREEFNNKTQEELAERWKTLEQMKKEINMYHQRLVTTQSSVDECFNEIAGAKSDNIHECGKLREGLRSELGGLHRECVEKFNALQEQLEFNVGDQTKAANQISLKMDGHAASIKEMGRKLLAFQKAADGRDEKIGGLEERCGKLGVDSVLEKDTT